MKRMHRARPRSTRRFCRERSRWNCSASRARPGRPPRSRAIRSREPTRRRTPWSRRLAVDAGAFGAAPLRCLPFSRRRCRTRSACDQLPLPASSRSSVSRRTAVRALRGANPLLQESDGTSSRTASSGRASRQCVPASGSGPRQSVSVRDRAGHPARGRRRTSSSRGPTGRRCSRMPATHGRRRARDADMHQAVPGDRHVPQLGRRVVADNASDRQCGRGERSRRRSVVPATASDVTDDGYPADRS